jgi:uncharacterized protein (TIGR02118 family)
MKTIALLVRRPGMSRPAFLAHYETVHAPLALSVMSGLQRYVRHHVVEELYGVPGFDVVSTFQYRDVAAMQAVVARLASPAGDPILRDELRFMDKSRNRFFPMRELAEQGAPDRSAALQLVALVRRGERESAAEFAAAFAAHALPELRDAVRGLRWLLHHEAIPGAATEAYDAAVQVHAAADAALVAWSEKRERDGSRVVLVRVEEHETPLPPGGLP